MKTLESKGVVRRIIEEEGEFLVSFPNHDGYFKVPVSDQAPVLKGKVMKSKADNKEIVFTFDQKLNILKIL
ncbi:MAG: hypothetical protein HY052_09235 [Proteobacteria bacterium]|nr:hypothetical protein [Pseudomonadota bacterium]